MTPDEDINLEEDGDTSFENLKNGLKKASEDLNNLADYCEQNFKGPEVVPDRPLTLENASNKMHLVLIKAYTHMGFLQ